MKKEGIIYQEYYDLKAGDCIWQVGQVLIIKKVARKRKNIKVYKDGKRVNKYPCDKVVVFEDGGIICEYQYSGESLYNFYGVDGKLKVYEFEYYQMYFSGHRNTKNMAYVEVSTDKLLKVGRRGKEGVFKANGDKILSIEFDRLQVGNKVVFARNGINQGAYYMNGEEAVPVEFKDLQYAAGQIYVKDNIEDTEFRLWGALKFPQDK